MVYLAIALALGSGIMISAQAPTNSSIGKVTSSIEASAISFGVGTLALIIVNLIFGTGNLWGLLDAPWWQWLGGFYGSFMVITSIVCIPRLGAILMSTLTMFGQLAMGILIDEFGWLGSEQIVVSPLRIAGCLLMAVAIIATYIGKNSGAKASGEESPMSKSYIAYASLPIIAGIGGAIQSATNSQLAIAIGNSEASLVNFAVGFLITFVLMLIMMKFKPMPVKGCKPWQFLGGVYGAIFVLVIVFTIPYLGVALNLAILMVGQLIGGMIIDIKGLFGMPTVKMNTGRWVGIALAVIGIAIITVARMI